MNPFVKSGIPPNTGKVLYLKDRYSHPVSKRSLDDPFDGKIVLSLGKTTGQPVAEFQPNFQGCMTLIKRSLDHE